MVGGAISARGAGVAASIEGFSNALEDIGHCVRVFALEDGSKELEPEPWRGAPATQFEVRGLRAFGFAPKMLPALLAWQADVVHLHGLWMYPSRVVWEWARRTRRPYLISPHGMLAPTALSFSKQKKRLARILYQDKCFRDASALHATSEAEANDIKLIGLDQPIDIIPLGIHLRARPHVDGRSKTILSLGRLHPVKGLDLLISAWAQLEPHFSDWHLKIVGPGEDNYLKYLQFLIAQHGLQRCHILPPLYGDEKYRCLSEAGLFVLPSHSENFGLTVLESLLMETPVIASQGTPWRLLSEQHCGDWVPLEVNSLAEAMARLLNMTNSDREAMGARGRDLVLKSFSWSAVARAAEASYQRILADTRESQL